MFEAIAAILCAVFLCAYSIYLTWRLNRIDRELRNKYEQLRDGLIKETKDVLRQEEPTVLVNDLQKIMEYSPSKKERQRRKYAKDGDQ